MDIGALRFEDAKQKRLAGFCIADGCMSASAVGSDFCTVGDDEAHALLAEIAFEEYVEDLF